MNAVKNIYNCRCKTRVFEMKKTLTRNTRVLSLFYNLLSIKQLGNMQQNSTQKNMIKACKMNEINV